MKQNTHSYRPVSGHRVLLEVSVCMAILDVGYFVHFGVNADLLLSSATLLEKIVYKWSDIDIYAMKLVLENYGVLVYMYYTHPGYQTSIFGKNRAYYIRIFTVLLPQEVCLSVSYHSYAKSSGAIFVKLFSITSCCYGRNRSNFEVADDLTKMAQWHPF